jgi:hypothetical protein
MRAEFTKKNGNPAPHLCIHAIPWVDLKVFILKIHKILFGNTWNG